VDIFQGDEDAASGTVNEGVIPGNALVVDKTKPFRALSSFGNNFLSRYDFFLNFFLDVFLELFFERFS